jgi:hypothetical protein
MFRREVTEALQRGTAETIGKGVRNAVMTDIEGYPMFFRDAPSEDAQRRITKKLGHPEGRTFTAEELEAIARGAEANREINDELLKAMQALYDNHDPRRMAGAALLGALGAGTGIALLTPGKDQGASSSDTRY